MNTQLNTKAATTPAQDIHDAILRLGETAVLLFSGLEMKKGEYIALSELDFTITEESKQYRFRVTANGVTYHSIFGEAPHLIALDSFKINDELVYGRDNPECLEELVSILETKNLPIELHRMRYRHLEHATMGDTGKPRIIKICEM